MTKTNLPRSHWTSRWAFIMVTAGSAIGLGNLWKFPYMAGTNGGSAFVLVYLACIVGIGLPLLMAETLLGRRGQGNPMDAMGTVAREAGVGSYWRALGFVGTIGALMILSFYSVVAGWILDYMVRAFGAYGGFTGITVESAAPMFGALLADPLKMIGWHTVFMVLTILVVARGVTGGIERANKIMMPALFVILIVLIIYGIVAADMPAAIRFMFHFDARQISPSVILAAMGHSFFTLSLGMGSIMTYGSYLDCNTSIARNCFYVALADTVIALLAGLAIFSVVFANGLAPAAGPGLILQTLPLAFAQMPLGQLVGVLFFVLVVFAAWTSSISLLEPFVSFLIERTSLSRVQAAWVTGLAVWCSGSAVALSFNDWSEVKIFGLGFFDLFDTLTSRLIMPISGLLIAVFVGWVMHKKHVAEELQLAGGGFALWYNLLRFVSPVVITLIFLNVMGWLG
ncbi:MAG: sodium-dependent transporter [Propionivibrio sp.]